MIVSLGIEMRHLVHVPFALGINSHIVMVSLSAASSALLRSLRMGLDERPKCSELQVRLRVSRQGFLRGTQDYRIRFPSRYLALLSS
jgi:hypothetical protein